MKTARLWKVAAVLGIASFAPAGHPAPARPVEFVREHVTVSVHNDHVFVDGIYLLRNPDPTDRIQALFYPFPVDPAHPFPDSISVTYRRQPVEFTSTEDGIAFSLEIPAGKQAGFQVTYRQTCLDSSACYILTTTSYWNEPLQSADFAIVVADDLVLDWSSYELGEENENGGTYTFGRDDFSPDRDLCLKWHSRSTTDTEP